MHVLNDVEYGRMLTPPTISMTLSDDEKAFIDAKIDWIGKLFIHSVIQFLCQSCFTPCSLHKTEKGSSGMILLMVEKLPAQGI